jgi:hypothetical protein
VTFKDGEEYLIEPIKRYKKLSSGESAEHHPHLIYKRSAIPSIDDDPEDEAHSLQKEQQQQQHQRESNTCGNNGTCLVSFLSLLKVILM